MAEVIPAVWSLEQVRQVQRLFVRLEVDRHYGRDVLDSVGSRLAHALTIDARPLAVELDARDFHMEQTDESDFTVTYTMGWRPSVKTVELAGGLKDGEVIEWEGAPSPFRVPSIIQMDPFDPRWTEAVDPTAPLEPQSVAYELAGWSEHNRRWIYRPAP